MSTYSYMYLIPRDEYHSLKNTKESHLQLIDSIKGDVKDGGQVNHIEIGEGGKVTIRPNGVTAQQKTSKTKPKPKPKEPFTNDDNDYDSGPFREPDNNDKESHADRSLNDRDMFPELFSEEENPPSPLNSSIDLPKTRKRFVSYPEIGDEEQEITPPENSTPALEFRGTQTPEKISTGTQMNFTPGLSQGTQTLINSKNSQTQTDFGNSLTRSTQTFSPSVVSKSTETSNVNVSSTGTQAPILRNKKIQAKVKQNATNDAGVNTSSSLGTQTDEVPLALTQPKSTSTSTSQETQTQVSNPNIFNNATQTMNEPLPLTDESNINNIRAITDESNTSQSRLRAITNEYEPTDQDMFPEVVPYDDTRSSTQYTEENLKNLISFMNRFFSQFDSQPIASVVPPNNVYQPKRATFPGDYENQTNFSARKRKNQRETVMQRILSRSKNDNENKMRNTLRTFFDNNNYVSDSPETQFPVTNVSFPAIEYHPQNESDEEMDVEEKKIKNRISKYKPISEGRKTGYAIEKRRKHHENVLKGKRKAQFDKHRELETDYEDDILDEEDEAMIEIADTEDKSPVVKFSKKKKNNNDDEDDKRTRRLQKSDKTFAIDKKTENSLGKRRTALSDLQKILRDKAKSKTRNIETKQKIKAGNKIKKKYKRLGMSVKKFNAKRKTTAKDKSKKKKRKPVKVKFADDEDIEMIGFVNERMKQLQPSHNPYARKYVRRNRK